MEKKLWSESLKKNRTCLEENENWYGEEERQWQWFAKKKQGELGGVREAVGKKQKAAPRKTF